MSCQELRHHITALVDQSLEPALVPQVQEHLAACPSCARFYAEQCDLTRLLEESSIPLDPPAGIWQRIEAHIEGKPGRSWGFMDVFRIPAWRYAWMGMAALVVLTLALINLRQQSAATRQILAELKSFELEVKGNPFWPGLRQENPFFKYEQTHEGNPFHLVEGENR